MIRHDSKQSLKITYIGINNNCSGDYGDGCALTCDQAFFFQGARKKSNARLGGQSAVGQALVSALIGQ